MSLVEYYDQLAEIALGWLGWTEQQALASDVNAIAVAYEGRKGMLQAIFGSADDADPAPKSRATNEQPMTPKLFRALFDPPKQR